jgi:hypothetical protein
MQVFFAMQPVMAGRCFAGSKAGPNVRFDDRSRRGSRHSRRLDLDQQVRKGET